MRVLFWNILHGGGPTRLPEILLTLLESKPDVVALCEFRAVRGGQFRAVLADHGLSHQATSHRSGRSNGMFVASKHPFTLQETPETLHGRELDLKLGEHGPWLTAVHVADDAHPTLKTLHWNRLVELARARRHEEHLIIGDLNTARGSDTTERLLCGERLGLLATLGYRDAWRDTHAKDQRGDTWISPWGEGRRIDAAYTSAALWERVVEASHHEGALAAGHSDHALLTVSFRETI
jgi:exonuclease III